MCDWKRETPEMIEAEEIVKKGDGIENRMKGRDWRREVLEGETEKRKTESEVLKMKTRKK